MIEQKSKFKQTEIGMIPEDWEKLKLSEAIDVNPKRELKKGVSAKKVSMDCLSPFNKKVKSFEISKFYGGSKFMNGDTIMARITPCLENGKTAFVDILSNNEVGFGSTEFIVLSGKNGKTNNDFVYYLSISPQLRKEAIKSMSGTSGRQRVQNDLFKEIELIIPPLQEQSAIAKILSDLDSKIELNQQMNKTLEAIGQAIFKHWFVDFEFPNENGEPYRSSGGEMIFNEELGKEIPKWWKVVKIEEIVSSQKYAIVDGPFGTQMKIKEYQGEGIPVIEMNFLEGYPFYKPFNHFISKEKFEEVKRSAVKKGDIIISKTGTLGLLGIMTDISEKAIIVSRLAKITPDTNKISRYYLFFILKQLAERGYWNQISSGSTMPIFNLTHIKNKQIVLPEKELMNHFEIILSKFYDQILNNLKQNQTLSQIRDSLLPRLMSGKIRVPVEVKT